jgi:hypothetical protein
MFYHAVAGPGQQPGPNKTIVPCPKGTAKRGAGNFACLRSGTAAPRHPAEASACMRRRATNLDQGCVPHHGAAQRLIRFPRRSAPQVQRQRRWRRALPARHRSHVMRRVPRPGDGRGAHPLRRWAGLPAGADRHSAGDAVGWRKVQVFEQEPIMRMTNVEGCILAASRPVTTCCSCRAIAHPRTHRCAALQAALSCWRPRTRAQAPAAV